MAGKNNTTAGDAAKATAKPTPTVAASVASTLAPDATLVPEEDTDDPVVLKQRLAQRDLRLDGLNLRLTNANDAIAALQNLLTDERTRSGNLAADLNESETLTEELQGKLATASLLQAVSSDSVIVSDGTHHYKVLAPKFKHKHVDYTAADLKTNEALVQELVAGGIGFLQKIETGE